jgi:hypothetical protein
MPVRQVPDRWRVAFSLAGEERDRVRLIAEEVERQLGAASVFYDEWFEHFIAGDDADLKLQDIYGRRCTLVVVCVSGHYGGKAWTQAEHRAIRARQMDAAKSQDAREALAILPLRVGDGDVNGVLFNTIAPDIRTKSDADAAALIIERLRLVEPQSAAAVTPALNWLEQAPELSWPMADHTEARSAFERLLLRSSPYRIQFIRGASGLGKSQITNQMLGNGLRIPDLACGRFDFKGTTGMDGELEALVRTLDLPLPPAGPRLNDRLGRVLDLLRERRHSTLLVFDTYEQAGEARDWMERQLLVNVLRSPWLRVVVAGQLVPDRNGALWESMASPTITLMPPSPSDWFAYAQLHRPDLEFEHVELFCRQTSTAGVLRALCGPRES